MGRRLRVLVLTKVFPTAVEPLAAAFNRQQFAALARRCDVELLVPVQWFPGAAWAGARTGAGRRAGLPAFDWIEGLFVRHPRVLHLPRIDYPAAAGLYFASLWPLVRKLARGFDVILGSFVYPDGVAAIWLGAACGLPAVVYALGSDINVAAKIPGVPAQLAHSLPRARRIVAVSRDLGAKVTALGAPAERVVVIPNGVDRAVFAPRDRGQARRALGLPLDARLIVYVGRLEAAKGLDELLAAFASLASGDDKVALALVGEGSWRARVDAAAARWPGRIFVPGGQRLDGVARWLAAADIATLPSHNEGTPNVVLEALASGRKVVATNVGGIPDLVTDARLGVLVPAQDATALATALAAALADPGDPASIAAAGTVSWDESADQLYEVLAAACD